MNIESFEKRLVHGGDTEFTKELPNGYGLIITENTPSMHVDEYEINFVHYDLLVYKINSRTYDCYNLNKKLERIYGHFCKDLNKILDVCDVIEELPKV